MQSEEVCAYIPIDCGFHDLLESLVVLGAECMVKYRSAEGEARSVTTRLLDVFAGGEEEFAMLESGAQIRLDRLLAVDGTPRPRAEISPHCANT